MSPAGSCFGILKICWTLLNWRHWNSGIGMGSYNLAAKEDKLAIMMANVVPFG